MDIRTIDGFVGRDSAVDRFKGERFRVKRWAQSAARLTVPLIAACALLRMEPWLTSLARTRPGVLPVAMFAFLGGLLVPPIRQGLIVVLCYGISLLSLRDAVGIVRLPSAIDFIIVERVLPYWWGAVALLAFITAGFEALRPGSVWARRCYFGAAALYLTGHGTLGLLRAPSWDALILCVTGLFAFMGIAMANRIVAAEATESAEDEDLAALRNRPAQLAEEIAAHEWREHREHGERLTEVG